MSPSRRPRSLGKYTARWARLRLELFEDRTVPGFLAPVSYALSASPGAVATRDVNGDGLTDVVTVNSNTISVLVGRGDGSFQAPRTVPLTVGSMADSVAVGDFNADGKLDLAVTCRQFFGPPRPPGVYEQAYDIVTSVKVLLGNSDGTFQPERTFLANNYATHMPPDYSVPSSVAVGDFNNDGTMDIAVSSRTGFQVHTDEPPLDLQDFETVLIGHGDGDFSVGIPTAIAGPPNSVATGDFDRDGSLDLVAAGGMVLLGRDDGSFDQNFTGTVGDNVAAADVNSDGILDLTL